MKKVLICLLQLFCLYSFGQPVRKVAVNTPLDSLNDEFNDTLSMQRWHRMQPLEQYPDKLKMAVVREGVLHLQPYACGWYAEQQAPFLYQAVTGNFDVTMKIKVSGASHPLPQSKWALAGLMVREAKKGMSKDWEARTENWLFLTTGVAEQTDVPVLESKSTVNSISHLKLRPAKEGWIELRIIRVQASFILLYRYHGEAWTIIERFYRPLLPQTLQVGMNAYGADPSIPPSFRQNPQLYNKTLFTDSVPDMLVEVDYVRFKRPVVDWEKLQSMLTPGLQAPSYAPPNILTDYSISNQALLGLLQVKD